MKFAAWLYPKIKVGTPEGVTPMQACYGRRKFIVITTADGERYVSPIGMSAQHAEAAEAALTNPGSEFLGAGFLGADEPKWDSGSCKKKFGRDCPADAALAEEVLRQVAEIFYPKD